METDARLKLWALVRASEAVGCAFALLNRVDHSLLDRAEQKCIQEADAALGTLRALLHRRLMQQASRRPAPFSV